LKHPLVVKRIEFFKAQEGFKEEDFDEMDEGKLLKTLRVTKNMLFLSEQLPSPKYDTEKVQKSSERNTKNTNNNATYSTTNKSSKNSLPNITTNSHYKNEDNKIANSESSNKLISKYKVVNQGTNGDTNGSKKAEGIKNNYNTENNKKIIIKDNPTTTTTSVRSNNISNNLKIQSHKEVSNSVDKEKMNGMPTHRLYQTKKGVSKKDKDFLRYLEGLGGNILYSKYAQQIEGNKYNNKNRVNNLYYKSSNKNQYLPSIYKNKSNNSASRYGVIRKKY
jgi:hypothetical protein